MLAINEKWNLLNFFLFKEKNHSTSMLAIARYTRNFSRFGYGGSSPCLGESDPRAYRHRACTQEAQKYQTAGTEIHDFSAKVLCRHVHQ